MLPDELRLAITVVANALIFVGAIRLVRRQGVRDWPQVMLDSFLLWYLVQYIAVGLPGIVGWLNAGSMIAVSLALIVLAQFVPASSAIDVTMSRADRRIVLGCLAVVVAL